MISKKSLVAVVGLGYVGLPLAVAFSRRYKTVGLDVSAAKVDSYRRCVDPTGEVTVDDLRFAVLEAGLDFSSDSECLANADFIVVAVPTPTDEANVPDFSPLVSASTEVGRKMKRGVTVIYESTVYPGATEEICIPILERTSGLTWKRDFHVGYSPERVNPGDKERTIEKIIKIVSGDDENTVSTVGDLYESIIEAGVYRASSIRVAEAAKIIENTQRDLNIALVNELAIIFDKLGIDTLEVLEAAGTKWNFMPFRPGLVGGHCIGVDPYYLTYKAEKVGYHPQVILAGRRINDGMAAFVASQTIKNMISAGQNVRGAKISIFGLTFKENCPDIRNSKIFDLIRELRDYDCELYVHDPLASASEVELTHGLKLEKWQEIPVSDTVILAVPHKHYIEMGMAQITSKLSPGGVFIDIKSTYCKDKLTKSGYRVWRL